MDFEKESKSYLDNVENKYVFGDLNDPALVKLLRRAYAAGLQINRFYRSRSVLKPA